LGVSNLLIAVVYVVVGCGLRTDSKIHGKV
jgi:hypothetical protein